MPSSFARRRRRLLLEWATGVQRPSICRRPPGLRDRPGQKPDHFWAKCLQAICYIQTGEYEGAKSSLNGCLTTDPKFAWLYLLRGFASGQIGARDVALAKTSPKLPRRALKGSAEFEFDEAEADFQKAIERLNGTSDDELQYVLLVNRGLVRFERGHLDSAAADFQEAIRSHKNPFLAHSSLASVYKSKISPTWRSNSSRGRSP